MQVLVSSSSTCPKGHAQNPTSHSIGGLGLLQVAFTGLQLPKTCPNPGHGTVVTHLHVRKYNNIMQKVILSICNSYTEK